MNFEQASPSSFTERRKWIVRGLSFATLASLGTDPCGLLINSVFAQEQAAPAKDDSAKLRTNRVKSVLELEGTVRLKNYRDKSNGEFRTASLKAKSELEFEEQFRMEGDKNNPSGVSLLQFNSATSNNQIDKNSTELKLRDNCREIFKKSSSLDDTLCCVNAPLTQAERDLVRGPVSTMFLELMLPSSKIKLGDSWKLSKGAVSKLMNLDMVTEGDLKITLIDADEQTGKLEIAGQLKGEVHDIGTSLKVQGKAHVNRTTGIVSWLAMVIEEERDVSEAEPGFLITARLRILREAMDELSSGARLEDVEATAMKSQSLELVQFESVRGAYKFIADKQWMTYTDSGVDATLRLTDKNRSVATCSITNLTDMEPGQQLSIEGFQNDIQKSLGPQFSQFLEAGESVTQTGLRMMRVVAMGKIQDVPIHWIHVLLSNDAGRHISLVYTIDATSVERFDANDMQMAGTFEFTLRQLPKMPKDESKAAADEKEKNTTPAAKQAKSANSKVEKK